MQGNLVTFQGCTLSPMTYGHIGAGVSAVKANSDPTLVMMLCGSWPQGRGLGGGRCRDGGGSSELKRCYISDPYSPPSPVPFSFLPIVDVFSHCPERGPYFQLLASTPPAANDQGQSSSQIQAAPRLTTFKGHGSLSPLPGSEEVLSAGEDCFQSQKNKKIFIITFKGF